MINARPEASMSGAAAGGAIDKQPSTSAALRMPSAALSRRSDIDTFPEFTSARALEALTRPSEAPNKPSATPCQSDSVCVDAAIRALPVALKLVQNSGQ
eukprot:CAMPEP_0172625386 /NCGR_PEP_ID=MMETSP1068-20121228/143545_1 /TAXON_ID=35684 /ORGANISM="Pseudopedinella elastica, Strain CCMP716" /LENGTH=98 /DNA_ID=CAMNT_0013434663 /DNA_START=311 /DNA_END=607 /DNA_ORIENTATION=+